MSDWYKSASWESLVQIVTSRRDDPGFDEAVNEINRRIPRATDYCRVISERFDRRTPLGNLPDWEPSGFDSPREDTWLVRLLSNDGHYPRNAVITDRGLLAADDRVAWSAVLWPGVHPGDDSRVAWLRIEEVYFLGAISLSVVPDLGRAVIYTQTEPEHLHVSEGAAFDEIYDKSRDLALQMSGEREALIRPDDLCAPKLFNWVVDDDVARLLTAMDGYHSAVLLRGLYKMLIAVEMRRFPHLLEEMALSALISREAALELLRRKFSAMAGKRLKKADVIQKIRSEFPTGEAFAEVLELDWENRVIMVHPVSEHGEFWSPMLEYEECTDTLASLIYLYRYLLLDEVWNPEAFE